jgi:CheY-like chemotaxis protein
MMAVVNPCIGRALLVESNEVLRSMAAEQLRQSGVEEVITVSRISAARAKLKTEHFDLVMYGRDLADPAGSDRELLNQLSDESPQPSQTVFIMVASTGLYAMSNAFQGSPSKRPSLNA